MKEEMANYTELQEPELQAIAGEYDLTVVGSEPFEGGSASSSYLLHTEQGRYVLTIFEIAMDRVVKIGRLLLHLAEYEFPTTRLLTPARGGVATVVRGKPVLLKVYIPGRVRQDLDGAMLHQLGATMARLHHIPAPGFVPRQHAYGLHVFRTVIGHNIDPEYESWLAERLAHFEHNLSPDLPQGLIHGDLFWDNVLFEGREFRAFLDFEDVCHYYKVFDLGMGIVGLCTEGATVALDKVRALVAGYQQVRALGDREIEALQLCAEYAAAATSCWRFWKYRIDTPTPELADRHRQMMRLAQSVRAIPKAEFR